MKTERGYLDLNIGAFLIALIVVGAVVGAVAMKLFDWLWPMLKAWIHTLTA